MERTVLILICVSLALTGCARSPGTPGVTSLALEEGTPEALGVLELLNHPGTDLVLLDVDAALDRRAAENLVAHRDGPDGLVGTSDDDLFDSIEEVDSVRYVGPAAIQKILDYALAHGWVAGDDDPLGIFDGVAFTVEEGRAVLELVNTADRLTLDDFIGLDRRAVDSILAARPIESIEQLSQLYYVGKTALRLLLQYAMANQHDEVEIGIISDLDRTVIPPCTGCLPDGPYPGVTALYNELEFRDEGHPGDVYYVTAREPDDIDDIPGWLESHGLPIGPIEPGVSGVPWVARPEKVADISRILDANPDQQFILLGDSNHVDPEVCKDIIELYPDRIRAALIHVVNQSVDEERLEGLLPHRHYAEAAAILFGLGELSEDVARGVMLAAKLQGLIITQAEMDDLIEQYR